MRIYDLIAKKRDGGTHTRRNWRPSSMVLSAGKWLTTRWPHG